MSVLRVIPIDELSHPYSGMSGIHEGSRILDGIFHGLEKRFNEGIVVADPRSRSAYGDLQGSKKR